jgi:hypothetical protein
MNVQKPTGFVTSYAAIPAYSSNNSSTKGSIYTSNTSKVTDCFPGISKSSNTKKFFVLNQGGRLQLSNITGQVDYFELFC